MPGQPTSENLRPLAEPRRKSLTARSCLALVAPGMPVAWPDEVPVAGIDASHRGPAPHDAAGAAEQQRRRPEFAALLGHELCRSLPTVRTGLAPGFGLGLGLAFSLAVRIGTARRSRTSSRGSERDRSPGWLAGHRRGRRFIEEALPYQAYIFVFVWCCGQGLQHCKAGEEEYGGTRARARARASEIESEQGNYTEFSGWALK